MTYLSGKRAFYDSGRLFEPLLTFMITFDALGIATDSMKRRALDLTPGNNAIEAHQFGLWIKYTALQLTDAMTKNIRPKGFEVMFTPDEGTKGPQLGPVMFGYMTMTMNITTAIYVQFYEQHAPWIRGKFSTDTKNWPPLFNFARAIRNFIVHHGGKVHFDNANAAPVQWHHLTYSPADKGKQAVGHGYISLGDLLVLLIEFGDALDAAGCPIPS
jgi:hypothetical protein